jgi:hypothetical protein
MWEDLPLWRSSPCAVQVSRFKRLPAMEKPLSRIGSEKKEYTKSLSSEILERPFVDILAFILMLEQELN